MASPTVTYDLTALKRRLRTVAKGSVKATAKSINKGLRAARTAGARAVAADTGVTVKRARNRIKLYAASPSRTGLVGKLQASRKPFVVLGGRQTRKGVTAGRGAGKQTYVRAWLFRKVILQRKGATRYPIRVITAPSAAEAWLPKLPEIERRGLDVMKRELDFQLGKL